MNIFKFIGGLLDKSAQAIDESLNVVVTTARTTNKAVGIAEKAVDSMAAEQQQELDAILALSAPPPTKGK